MLQEKVLQQKLLQEKVVQFLQRKVLQKKSCKKMLQDRSKSNEMRTQRYSRITLSLKGEG